MEINKLSHVFVRYELYEVVRFLMSILFWRQAAGLNEDFPPTIGSDSLTWTGIVRDILVDDMTLCYQSVT